MPTETPSRPVEADEAWDDQDLTSSCDVELDTITADLQIEIRRRAARMARDDAAETPA